MVLHISEEPNRNSDTIANITSFIKDSISASLEIYKNVHNFLIIIKRQNLYPKLFVFIFTGAIVDYLMANCKLSLIFCAFTRECMYSLQE